MPTSLIIYQKTEYRMDFDKTGFLSTTKTVVSQFDGVSVFIKEFNQINKTLHPECSDNDFFTVLKLICTHRHNVIKFLC